MLKFGNKEFNNLQEQVLENANDILEIKQSLGTALPNPIAGPEGPVGPQGPQGVPGQNVNFTVGTDLPASANNGDLHLKFNGELYQYVNNSWVLQTSLKGPQGVQGSKGLQGEQGPKGETGPRGEQGKSAPIYQIAGKVDDISQLPAPSTVASNTAYVVGETVYGIIGNEWTILTTWTSWSTTADKIIYDNLTNELVANNVQEAIDETLDLTGDALEKDNYLSPQYLKCEHKTFSGGAWIENPARLSYPYFQNLPDDVLTIELVDPENYTAYIEFFTEQNQYYDETVLNASKTYTSIPIFSKNYKKWSWILKRNDGGDMRKEEALNLKAYLNRDVIYLQNATNNMLQPFFKHAFHGIYTQGHLDESYGGYYPNRSTSRKILSFPYDITIYLKDKINYEYNLHYFSTDEPTTYIDWTDWLKEPIVVPANTYFSISLRKTDNSNLKLVDLSQQLFGVAGRLSSSSTNVKALNKDKEIDLQSMSKYYVGFPDGNPDIRNNFTMLITTDIHEDTKALKRAIDYVNEEESIECACSLGDMAGGKFTDTDGSWYSNLIHECNKNFYTVVGNHDSWVGDNTTSATQQEVFDKWILPNRDKMGLPDLTTSYWRKDINDRNITLIGLNIFDSSATYNLSQEQVNWLVSQLNDIPSNNHLVILSHYIPEDNTKIENPFSTNKYERLKDQHASYPIPELLTDLVNAWINGTSVSKTYSTITVNADFTARGTGNFVCYLTGHYHVDMVVYIDKYPNQKYLTLSTTSSSVWQTMYGDLPRDKNTKSEDLLTVFSVDTVKRHIYLVRLGSDTTFELTDRKKTCIEY